LLEISRRREIVSLGRQCKPPDCPTTGTALRL
jgi:hypothetical protein